MPPIGDHAWVQDATLGVQGLHLTLLKIGMHLDLIHRRHHRGLLQQPGQVLDHEVADPDRADLPVAEQALQPPIGLQRRPELRRQRLMQDQQIDLVDTELAGTLLEPVQSLVVAVVTDPDLGLHEHLGAVQTSGRDPLTDLPLIAVRGRGIDVAVAGLQRNRDRIAGLLRRGLKHPKTQARA